MITGTVWGVALVVVGGVTTLAALQLLFAAVFPRRLEASRHAIRTRPWLCGFAGAVAVGALLVAIGIAGAVFKAVPAIAGALALAASLLGVFGLTAVSAELGARLPSSGAAASPWRAQIRGAVTLLFASLVPLAGWVVVFPAALACGLGAWILGIVGPGVERPAEPERVASASPPAPVATEETARV